MDKDFKENVDMEKDIDESVKDTTEDENTNDVNEETVETDEIEEEIKDSDLEIDRLKDNFIRLQADFTNYKRRAEADKKEYITMGTTKIALKLLEVVDNFERAIEHDNEEKGAFFDGIVMIKNQLVDVLKSEDIVEMNVLHKKFDPNFHHAVLTEDSDEFEEDTVIEVLQKGYLIKDKILRPAMVKVSR